MCVTLEESSWKAQLPQWNQESYDPFPPESILYEAVYVTLESLQSISV